MVSKIVLDTEKQPLATFLFYWNALLLNVNRTYTFNPVIVFWHQIVAKILFSKFISWNNETLRNSCCFSAARGLFRFTELMWRKVINFFYLQTIHDTGVISSYDWWLLSLISDSTSFYRLWWRFYSLRCYKCKTVQRFLLNALARSLFIIQSRNQEIYFMTYHLYKHFKYSRNNLLNKWICDESYTFLFSCNYKWTFICKVYYTLKK